MTATRLSPQQQVIAYFESLEARAIYAFFGGVRHFGYFPAGQESLSIREAQGLMTDRLGDALDLQPSWLVLDAGCGEGPAAVRLARTRGVRVRGIDLLPRSIGRARRRARYQSVEELARFEVMDYTRLAFPDSTFDAVYTMEAFVHAPDHDQVLREFRRVLKDGGRLGMCEYTMAPMDELSAEQRRIATFVCRGSAMHSLPQLTNGAFPGILAAAGFEDVQVEDLTQRVMPMAARMYRRLWFPYQLVRLLRLERWFVTTAAVVEAYPYITRQDVFRYVLVTARK